HIFIIRKEIINKKVLKSELTNYKKSHVCDDFMYESDFFLDEFSIELFNEIHGKIHNELLKGNTFSKELEYLDTYYLISFQAIKNVQEEHVAYLISYEEDSTLHNYYIRHILILIAAFIIGFIIYYLFLLIINKNKKLFDSEHRFKQLSNLTFEGIVIHDKGLILEANLSMATMFGYEANELTGQSVNILLASDEDRVIVKKNIIKNYVSLYEVNGIRKDGSIFPVEVEAKSITHKDNNLIRVAALRDISQRKQAEKALKDSEEKYRLLAEHTYDWEYWLKPDGSYNYISPSCYRTSGYTSEEFKYNPDLLIDIVQTSFKKQVIQHFTIDSSSEKKCESFEFVIITKDGSKKWIEHICHPVYDKNNVFMGRRGTNRDISERRLNSEKLKNHDNKLISIFKSAPVGIGVVSNRKIQEINERFCEIVGYSKEELIGKNSIILYSSQEEYDWVGKEKYRQIQIHGTGSVETHLKKKNGEIINVILSSTPIDPDDLSVGVTFTALDITEKTKLETQLRQSQKLEGIGQLA
ncbi:MAG: PAS domain S-box protein, partial [Candidatus Marinimicrobia bacterium]|nr:PAS domain S-box protein [Candidatus Neomarinimicrobiota bacterium]